MSWGSDHFGFEIGRDANFETLAKLSPLFLESPSSPFNPQFLAILQSHAHLNLIGCHFRQAKIHRHLLHRISLKSTLGPPLPMAAIQFPNIVVPNHRAPYAEPKEVDPNHELIVWNFLLRANLPSSTK